MYQIKIKTKGAVVSYRTQRLGAAIEAAYAGANLGSQGVILSENGRVVAVLRQRNGGVRWASH